jgi:hypothetical protein
MGPPGGLSPQSSAHPFHELPPVPSGMRAVAAEQTEPARMPPLRSRSIAPILILIFLIIAGAGTAVWFLVLRPQTESREQPASGPTDGSGSAAAPEGPGSARTGAPSPEGNRAEGSAATPSGSPPPQVELTDTVIAASVEGATVEIPGTSQSGPAPFTAKLEKGRSYKARVSAHGYAISELEIRGGDARQTAKLVAKPRMISIASEPAGAAISVDGTSTGHITPFDVELAPPQGAGKKTIRVSLRKSGYRTVDRTLDLARFTEEDTRMTFKLDEKLSQAPVSTTTRNPPGGGSARSPGSDAGSGTGEDGASVPSGGSAQGSGSDGTASAPTPGAGSGSAAEPEPEFNKHP